MDQPRYQHYHFAYTALPSKVFAGCVPSMLLAAYPDGFVGLLHRLWEVMGERLPPEERAPVEGLTVTAHRIGGKLLVLLIHMPPPERSLETYFIALVFTPAVRYFTLGRSAMSLPGLPADIFGEGFCPTTFREVSPGMNGNRGMGCEPSAEAFLERLCGAFDLPNQVEGVSPDEVRALAKVVPACGPSIFDTPPPGESRAKKRWWKFWA